MHVYSPQIVQFIREIKRTIKHVLATEVGLKVSTERFYDRTGRISYPISVVIFCNQSMLGYFDPNFYELGFHESLMHISRKQLHQVIRHELAHYLTFIEHGEAASSHGSEFRECCKKLGWGEEVYRATICLEGGPSPISIEASSVLRKVHKLMALSSSSNPNEAELAMIKSQQLLLKHNLENTQLSKSDEEKLFLKRIMENKRVTGKMRAIAKILETFFVSIVYSRSKQFTCLELLGNAVNLEIADHVATVLNVQFDSLWHQAQQQSRLKGTVAKNSFFLGIAKGYCTKIQALKQEHSPEVAHALMVMEHQLSDAKAWVYSRLSSTRSQGSYCKESSLLGERIGRELTINPALKQHSENSLHFLS